MVRDGGIEHSTTAPPSHDTFLIEQSDTGAQAICSRGKDHTSLSASTTRDDCYQNERTKCRTGGTTIILPPANRKRKSYRWDRSFRYHQLSGLRGSQRQAHGSPFGVLRRQAPVVSRFSEGACLPGLPRGEPRACLQLLLLCSQRSLFGRSDFVARLPFCSDERYTEGHIVFFQKAGKEQDYGY